MIYLNSQRIKSIEELSSRFRAILSMISGGDEWMKWAVDDTITPTISAHNEHQLLNIVQTGVNNTEYIQFNTFRASINKIQTFSDTDVELLATIRKTADDNEKDLGDMLHRNDILSYAEMYDAAAFVSSEAVHRKDMFQYPSFSDMLALTAFVHSQKSVTEHLKTASYKFAQEHAAFIPGFIDLVEFYQYIIQQHAHGTRTRDVKASTVHSIYTRLIDKVPYLLFTPVMKVPHSMRLLRERVSEIAGESRFIGYITGTSCLSNLARNIHVVGHDEKSIQEQIDNYLRSIRKFVSITTPSSHSISQDGKLSILRFENSRTHALVGIDDKGNIFILPGTKIYSHNDKDHHHDRQ